MRIKPGVSVFGLRPETWGAVLIAESIYRRYAAEVVITSGTEPGGGHKPRSAHWTGRAVDLRTKNLPQDTRQAVVDELTEACGDEYDVIFEGAGEPWEHIHVEYDPVGA